jgi:hypothetical protein
MGSRKNVLTLSAKSCNAAWRVGTREPGPMAFTDGL